MTEIQAINELDYLLGYENAIDKGYIEEENHLNSEEKEALKFILDEIRQYRAIGTVEELKALKEKEERFDRNIKMFNEIGLEIRNNAIDEFSEKLLQNCNYVWDEDFGYTVPVNEIENIAEQLKGGATDERTGSD